MKYKEFSPEFEEQFEEALKNALKGKNQPVAAFDADGTLWDTDLGENFFQYQIDQQLVPLPPDPWKHYRDLKKKNHDPSEAYLWLAQILAGVSEGTMRQWARAAVDTYDPLPVFAPQKKLIQRLLRANIRVFIVTASVKWAVDPGASFLELSPENVIGIETEIENGKVTDRQKGLITYKNGKPRALLERTNGQRPFFCSGNSNGDIELLESATHLQLCVSAAPETSELFAKEQELFHHADKHGWHKHRLVMSS